MRTGRSGAPDGQLHVANERLARFYGIRNVYGTHFRRGRDRSPGPVAGSRRCSHRHVVRDAHLTGASRQVFLDNILGSPPAPPPPNVRRSRRRARGSARSSRCASRMEARRQNPICATVPSGWIRLGVCARKFSIRSGSGDERRTSPIDARACLPRWHEVSGARRVRKGLNARRDEFAAGYGKALDLPTEATRTTTSGAPHDHAGSGPRRLPLVVAVLAS